MQLTDSLKYMHSVVVDSVSIKTDCDISLVFDEHCPQVGFVYVGSSQPSGLCMPIA